MNIEDMAEDALVMLGDMQLGKIAAASKAKRPALAGEALLSDAKGSAKHFIRKQSGPLGFLTADLIWQHPNIQRHVDRKLRALLGVKAPL